MEEECAEHNELQSILDGTMEPGDLPFSLLQKITRNFSEEQKIGVGGFADVYKGVLPNGNEVAVKRIRSSKTIDETLFQREVSNLTRVNHQNIVRFLGFCSNTTHKQMEYQGQQIFVENKERLLCFEYISNGSLDKYVTDELRGLEWSIRYDIIKGICYGLEYLHVNRKIVHMDLKPANILFNNDWMAKITDFGLSRMSENLQTITSNLLCTLGYCAPEYIQQGKISDKYDVYSLGVIIIELVTGRRNFPDKHNVLRRWRHRQNKSGQETPFRYQQVAKLIDIGLLCMEIDPCKRPSISEIIHDINELESVDMQISTDEPTIGQIRPNPEDDMLGIEPLELCFYFKLNKETTCPLELTNKTNSNIAFSIGTPRLGRMAYSVERTKGTVPPQSKLTVNITLQPLDRASEYKQHTSDFIVRSTKVNDSLTSEAITEDMFREQEGRVVDEVNVTVVLAEAKNMVNSCTSDELISLEPPELRFPLLSGKKVLSSVTIVNKTEWYVGISLLLPQNPNMAIYQANPYRAILPARSTRRIMVIMIQKEETPKDTQFNDKLHVFNAIVSEHFKDSDLRAFSYSECKELPIMLTKTSRCTSNEMIELCPPELNLPLLPNIPLVFSINIVNNADFSIGFCFKETQAIAGMYTVHPHVGIVQPHSPQRVVIRRAHKEKEQLAELFRRRNTPSLLEDMQYYQGSFFVWNMIVAEGVKPDDNLIDSLVGDYAIEVPVTLHKRRNANFTIHDLISHKLIRFDPPRLSFPFLPNKTLLSSVNMVNNTDYSVGFCNYVWKAKALYYTEPRFGILPPRSTQKLVVKRVPTENEPHHMTCKDKYIVWTAIVPEGVEASDLSCVTPDKEGTEWPNADLYNRMAEQVNTFLVDLALFFGVTQFSFEHTQLPLVFTKISSSTSNEHIQIEPPKLYFPVCRGESQKSSVNIVNITDYFIGFNTFNGKTNVALYNTEPRCGILPPRSTQELVVTRVAQENEALEDIMHCKDKYFLWSSFVTEDVDAINLRGCTSLAESKDLPIVFTKGNSNDLIQFDPTMLCLPLLSNKSVLSLVSILNVTDNKICFSIRTESNSARYYTDPSNGILLPRSRKVLMVTRMAEKKELQDKEFKDKYMVWSRTVPEDVKGCGISDCMVEQEIKRLPIVLSKTRPPCTTEEPIQFDPPELSFPFLPNKTVVSSVNIVNNTDFTVGFCVRDSQANVGTYKADSDPRILQPRSAHKMLVKRVPTEEDIQGWKKDINKDMLLVWYMILAEGVEAHNLVNYLRPGNTIELPIVLTKTIQCTTNELIKFDPPQLRFPFLQNKTLLSSVNMINNTYHSVIFCNYVWNAKARYYTEPRYGILPPRSTKKLVVKRVPAENEQRHIKCKDKYILWNAIVTEGVEASDLCCVTPEKEGTEFPNHDLYHQTGEQANRTLWSWPNLMLHCCVLRQKENTELPIVLTKVQHHFTTGSSWWSFSLSFPTGMHQHHLIRSSTGNEVIQIEPPELCFPFLSSEGQKYSLKILNITDHIVGFNTFGKKTNVALYNTEPPCGILPPNSTQVLVVTRVAQQQEALEDMMHCKDKYYLWSSFVTQEVDAINLKGCTSETESKDLPIVFTETSSNEWIQFDPPELLLPLLSNKCVLSSVNIVNVTDHHISFDICTKSDSARYYTDPSKGILPPRSRQVLKVIRAAEEKELQNTEFKDKYLVWNSVVTEGVEESTNVVPNLAATKITELPIVLTETPLKASIQFDPPELCFPLSPKGKALSSVNVVNITDSYIGFSTYSGPTNEAWYHTKPPRGILPPRAKQRLMVTRVEKKCALGDIQFNDKYFVWNNIVPKGVKSSGISDYMVEQESKELPIVLTKTSPQCTSEQLIRFEPVALSFPFQPNQTVVSAVTIINITDYCVGFNQYANKGNVAWYHTYPQRGIIPPRSSQKLVVKRVLKRKGQGEDMHREDKLFLWNMTVTEGVKAGYLINRMAVEDSVELPIVLEKKSLLCTSGELFQFDPCELHFPIFPNKSVPTLCKVKIVNNTHYSVGFSTWTMNRNSATYNFKPREGILPPQSTKALTVRRELKENESQNMQLEDDVVGLWNGIVTDGVEAGDLTDYMNDEESKVLPIVLTNTKSQHTILEDLIRFDPPELSFPFLPNKTVVSSVIIINNTDHYVGFNRHDNRGNVAWHHTNPRSGIIPPRDTQRLVVRRVAKKKEQGDMPRVDRIFLWNMIVTEGVEASDLSGWVDDKDSTELPIVLEKTRACTSNELIKFDRPELHFPFSLNKRAPMMCPINIYNVTDHWIGFSTYNWNGNRAWYIVDPPKGILPPRSEQTLMINRVPKENESENMLCKDDIVGVWNGVLTKGVEVGDIPDNGSIEECMQLPVVLTKSGESSSPQGWLGRIFGK